MGHCARSCGKCATGSSSTGGLSIGVGTGGSTSLGGVSTGGGTCKDKASNCARLLGRCKNPSWARYMSNQCAKSCGKCATGSSSTGGLSTGGGTCQDKVTNCASLSS